MSAKKDPFWMEHAETRMEKKGTKGSFGKATKKKISAGKSAGGKREKKAVFAQNAAKAARGK